MNETYISFYLKASRIHVFVDSLRSIGSPRLVQFLISNDGSSLAMVPCNKKDFRSHRIPQNVYSGKGKMEISSMKLCTVIAGLHAWDITRSYRVPGVLREGINAVIFELNKAEEIEKDDE